MLWRSPTLVAQLRTVDLSLGGARVYTDDRLKIGQKLELDLLVSEGRTVNVLVRSRLTQVLERPDQHPEEEAARASSKPSSGGPMGQSG